MPPEVLERMMRQILPFRFTAGDVGGIWKLNQNNPDAAREAAAGAVRHSPIALEVEALSALMTGELAEMDKGPAMT